MPSSKKLTEILQQTEENINNKRNYKFKIQRSIPDNLKQDYYEKYLAKSINKNAVRTIITEVKKQNGEIEEVKTNYEAMPVHNYNTLLAMAFYKAFEFYSNIRKRLKSPAVPVKLETGSADETITEIATLSSVECLVLSRQLQQGKNSALLKSIKQNNLQLLNEFHKIENINAKVLEELRNYHAHIFHEPGPVYFDNFYGDDYKPKKKLSTQEWSLARDYFQKLFYDVKDHLLKTVNKQLEENAKDKKAIEEIEKVKNKISSYEFQVNGRLTYDALLFIACYFLRKGDANFFIKKWPGIKKAEGFSKTSQTFFNYYSIKDSKSLHTHNDDLFKFRQLLGILGTFPVLKNECFKPFYELIEENNDYYAEKVEKARNKNEKDRYLQHIIPLRKSLNYTRWYMQYLKDKGLLNDFKIAFYKRIEERKQFLEENKIEIKIDELKLQIKMSSGDEKRRLNEVYKQSKKNFVFREATTDDDNFCTKRENAIIQYSFKVKDTNEAATIQVNLSPAFLMKWIFADIVLGKGAEIKKRLEEFVRENYYKLQAGVDFTDRDNIPASKIFPPSLLRTSGELNQDISSNKVKLVVGERIKELQKFMQENENKRAPWKFAAKKKIDIIFGYVHFKYLSSAYDLKKDENTVRHEAMNDMEYLDALEKIRFYGKEYQSEEFKSLFREKKVVYFKPIIKYFQNGICTSLEQLFNAVANDYNEFLTKTEFNIKESTLARCTYIFKIKNPVLNPDKKKLARLFSLSQDVPHELINVRDLASGSVELEEWKMMNQTKDPHRLTDFSFMRNYLCKDKPFSNTDFMMQSIMPILLGNGKLLNEKGKIQSNTSLFNNLYSSKTEELIMWNIANNYWNKANGKENTRNRNIIFIRNESKTIQPAYRELSIYNKIYKEEMEIKLQRQTKTGGTPVYTLKISPKKFDDEFQHYKQDTLIDYIEFCIDEKEMTQPEKEKKIWDFIDLNKKIQDKLTKYLDDVYLLLTIEKSIVIENIKQLKEMFKLTKDDKLPGIYLFFGRVKTAGENNMKNMIVNLVYDELGGANILSFTHASLIEYRNKTMHQQLINEKTHILIRKSLFEYCKTKGILQD